MRAETDLAALLTGMSPELRDGEFFFCLFVPAERADEALRVLCGLAGEVAELRGERLGVETGLRREA